MHSGAPRAVAPAGSAAMASTSARVDPTRLSTSSARRRAVHGHLPIDAPARFTTAPASRSSVRHSPATLGPMRATRTPGTREDARAGSLVRTTGSWPAASSPRLIERPSSPDPPAMTTFTRRLPRMTASRAGRPVALSAPCVRIIVSISRNDSRNSNERDQAMPIGMPTSKAAPASRAGQAAAPGSPLATSATPTPIPDSPTNSAPTALTGSYTRTNPAAVIGIPTINPTTETRRVGRDRARRLASPSKPKPAKWKCVAVSRTIVGEKPVWTPRRSTRTNAAPTAQNARATSIPRSGRLAGEGSTAGGPAGGRPRRPRTRCDRQPGHDERSGERSRRQSEGGDERHRGDDRRPTCDPGDPRPVRQEREHPRHDDERREEEGTCRDRRRQDREGGQPDDKACAGDRPSPKHQR